MGKASVWVCQVEGDGLVFSAAHTYEKSRASWSEPLQQALETIRHPANDPQALAWLMQGTSHSFQMRQLHGSEKRIPVALWNFRKVVMYAAIFYSLIQFLSAYLHHLVYARLYPGNNVQHHGRTTASNTLAF